jgi:hypothetical protein
MRLPFERWAIRFGILIAACMVNAGASAAARLSIEHCIDDLAAGELDSIRSKADLSRIPADGPPPFRIALNDTFATDSERADIAKWIRIQNLCRRRFAIPRSMPPPGIAIEAASLQQASALSRILQLSFGRLIRALYCQELTYGEFARKRYEFTRDAAALSSAIEDAGLGADQTKLRQTLRQLRYLKISWNAYLWRLDARRPATVHIHGAINT